MNRLINFMQRLVKFLDNDQAYLDRLRTQARIYRKQAALDKQMARAYTQQIKQLENKIANRKKQEHDNAKSNNSGEAIFRSENRSTTWIRSEK